MTQEGTDMSEFRKAIETMGHWIGPVDEKHLLAAQDAGRRAAKARRHGDEALAQLLTRKWKESLPAYGSEERRWLDTIFNNAYRETSGVGSTNIDS